MLSISCLRAGHLPTRSTYHTEETHALKSELDAVKIEKDAAKAELDKKNASPDNAALKAELDKAKRKTRDAYILGAVTVGTALLTPALLRSSKRRHCLASDDPAAACPDMFTSVPAAQAPAPVSSGTGIPSRGGNSGTGSGSSTSGSGNNSSKPS